MIERTIFNADHEAFRDSFRRFMDKEIAPTTTPGKSKAMWTAPSGKKPVRTAFCA